MSSSYTSVCTRCGKDRIILKTWTETHETRAGMASISYKTMTCPDPECQAIVDGELSVEKTKREIALKTKLQEAEARKRAILRNRASKAASH